MKQITVISGKGGTGKTSILAALAYLAEDTVLADCDVDSANLHILLDPIKREREKFYALKTARIDKDKCVECGKCYENCVFNAVKEKEEKYEINPLSCEGCAVCDLVCPEDAIVLEKEPAGKFSVSDTIMGSLVHAKLYPGEEASGKLVTKVREKAKEIAEKEEKKLILIDGSPGIGCPVIASIGGVDLALIVTEPTVAGIHDLKRILSVTKHFQVKSLVCVNKADLNEEKTREIKEYCHKNNIEVIGSIPYDNTFTKAMVEKKTIMEQGPEEIQEKIHVMWNEINNHL